MRTDISHLPARNQHELERVVRAIFEEFEEAHREATGERRRGRILKVILYGSFARGNWVYEPDTAKAYASDYDILVIVDQDELADMEHWFRLEDRLSRDYVILHRLRHPVNLIVHTLQEVNNNLAQGRYFFTDIARDGVALYQSDDSELATPQPKSAADALALSEEYFEDWYPSAGEFFDGFEFGLERKRYKYAAFQLHQAAERLYHAILLTCTLYTPHSHNLEYLRRQARKLDRRLLDIWPEDTRIARRRFNLLKDAYVKARYSKHYRVSQEDLTWLGERVQELSAAVQAIAMERFAELRRRAKAEQERSSTA
ncbi:HEPN domain-containing protein [Sphingomonas lycopersici]|uniref:HEPN domain-containing protein n=1 Tax=Sphingomonas lycopersici TaxID=2951807 RepID=A0AA41ZJJ6_9SPHN|nr:HEPN domain-containing protein [Sphingomonas lycopersici]MCW6536923.1 HEPN domain-containing protein [Sphingomonas lycopersici]